MIVALLFTQGGEAVNLYEAIAWYDRVVHVVVPLLASQVVYLVEEPAPVVRERTYRDPRL